MKRPIQWLIGALVVLGGGAVIAIAWGSGGVSGSGELHRELRDRGTIAVVGDRDDLLRLGRGATELVAAAERPALARALEGSDPRAVVAAMQEDGVDGLLADGRLGGDATDDASVRARLSAYAYVEGLSAAYLTPAAALYLPANVETLEPPLDDALVTVARGILEGSRPPRVSSFPEPLRRMRNVEVMVMLRDRGRARLWRSARGSSIARALVTASLVARQRWEEREQAMGGPLDDKLPHLDVEVVLLDEDGTLGVRSASFIDRAFTGEHGVAYERRGAWRYLLPDATRSSGEGSAVKAYEMLFAEHGLPADSFERSDLRLYRLVARELAESPAPLGPADDDPLGFDLDFSPDAGSP